MEFNRTRNGTLEAIPLLECFTTSMKGIPQPGQVIMQGEDGGLGWMS